MHPLGVPHRVHPDFLAHLPTNVTQPLCAVDAHGFQPAITKHTKHLSIFCKAQRCSANDKEMDDLGSRKTHLQ